MNRSILCGLASFAMLVGVAMFSSNTPTAEARHGCGGGLFGGHHGSKVCSGGGRGGLFSGLHRRGGCGGGLFGHHRARKHHCGGYVSTSNGCYNTTRHYVAQPQNCCPQPAVQQQACCPQPTDCCSPNGYQSGSYHSGGYQQGGIVPGSGCVGCESGQTYGQPSYSAGYGNPQYGGQPQSGAQPYQGGQPQGDQGQYQEQYDEI